MDTMNNDSGRYKQSLSTLADWAVFHGFKQIIQATLATMTEMGLEISPEITARAAFRAVTDSLDALTYASDPELFDNVIGLISAMVVYRDLADADKYEWYSMLRELVRQGAMALLAKQFLTNPAIAPGSPDDITIPRTFKAEDFQVKMEKYFDAHVEIYEGREDDLDADKATFMKTGIFLHKPADKKKTKKMPAKSLLCDLFNIHSLDTFKTKALSYFRTCEHKMLTKHDDHVPKVISLDQHSREVNTSALAAPEWSASRSTRSGPYADSTSAKAKAASRAQQQQEAFASAPDLEQDDEYFTASPVITSRASDGKPAAAPGSVKPGQLAKTVKQLDRKYDALDPLEHALGGDGSSRQAESASNNRVARGLHKQKRSNEEKDRKRGLTDGRKSGEKIDFRADDSDDAADREKFYQQSPKKKRRFVSQEDIEDAESEEEHANTAAALLKSVKGRPSNSRSDELPQTLGTPKSPLRARRPDGRLANRKRWTMDEEDALQEGIEKYGEGNWQKILDDPNFGARLSDRSGVNLKDKYRNILKNMD